MSPREPGSGCVNDIVSLISGIYARAIAQLKVICGKQTSNMGTHKAVQTEPVVKERRLRTPPMPHCQPISPASLLLSGRWLRGKHKRLCGYKPRRQNKPSLSVSACPGRAGCVFVRPNQMLLHCFSTSTCVRCLTPEVHDDMLQI